jgi:hypothetical protein
VNAGTTQALVELAGIGAFGGVSWLALRVNARRGGRGLAVGAGLATIPEFTLGQALMIGPPPPSPAQVAVNRAAAERAGWQQLLVEGRLRPVAPSVACPGNPGRWLTLAEDPTGALGDVRVLVGVDGSPQPDGQHAVIGVVVPGHLSDPIAAAAWTYDDPTHPLRTSSAVYADMAVRH